VLGGLAPLTLKRVFNVLNDLDGQPDARS
jgi:hypothetical protein